MKRLHLHISVNDIKQNIEFYSKLFGRKPSVVHEDYAKWLLDDPYINFAISNRNSHTGLDHLGFQVDDESALKALKLQLEQTDAEIVEQEKAACCYSRSDKYWLIDPQGIAWESFHTLDEIPTFNDQAAESDGENPFSCIPVVAEKSSCCG